MARLELKIKALTLNTLRRLLTGEEAHSKHFTSHFLRVSGMHLGKLTLATDFAPRDIDSNVPAFHKELLCAWINHFLPVNAVHEILMDHDSCRDRTFNQTARELSEVLGAIPAKWKLKVINGDSVSPSTAQPSFSILPSAPGKPPTSILDCKTRHFYRHLHKSEQISTPGLDYWRTKFQLQGPFNSSFWNTVYSPLVTNKHGDLNWKVAHKALLTALRLNRMGVYASENCHRCGIMKTIEHELVECPVVCHFWDHVQVPDDKITNSYHQDNALWMDSGRCYSSIKECG